MNSSNRREVRSFVRRMGRLTSAQRRALEQYLPLYGLAMDAGLPDLWHAQPTVLEIGFGMGEALLQLAHSHPQINFVGMDVHRPGVGHLLNGVHQAGLTNVRVIEGDAMQWLSLPQLRQSFDALLLWFPDPWPKKRHHKRRLVQSEFLHRLSEVLKPGGYWHFASDWVPYVEHVRQQVSIQDRLQLVTPDQLQGQILTRPRTKFEQRGLGLGYPISDIYCQNLP